MLLRNRGAGTIWLPFSERQIGTIGEIWFEHPAGKELPLLMKYIFTSEKLSVQVHPNDEEARDRGLERGKNECWYILDAAEGATAGPWPKATCLGRMRCEPPRSTARSKV